VALTLDQQIAATRQMLAAEPGVPFNFSKADIRAAIVAADAWATSNASSFNSALPTVFRNGGSASQKALLLAFVCLRRAGQ
jgi:hypothetical protein